jgi:site-specific DNA-methyltransferase (adenine-specific)
MPTNPATGNQNPQLPFPKTIIHPVDCVAGMAEKLAPGSVDVIVTSPPYNIGKAYSKHDDTQDPEDYLDWMARVSAACERVLSAKGSFFLNLGGKPSDPGWPFRVLTSFDENFELQNTIIWVKSIVIEDDGSGEGGLIRGHYKPVHSPRYLSGFSEYVFHLTKNGDVPLDKLRIGSPYKHKSNVERWDNDGQDLRERGNVWFIPYDTIQTGRPHPCVFPAKLPSMCIQLHGLERTRLVMDPFLGTGSTAVAALRNGVDFVGFEIDPAYVTLATDAVEEERKDLESTVAFSRSLP